MVVADHSYREAYTDCTRRCTRPIASSAVTNNFTRNILEHDRDVLVWLRRATDMRRSDVRYPVLYMHDGQNLFEPETAFQKGEHWRVGETATELIEAGRIEPLIIVGIYNTGRDAPRRIHADRRHEARRRPCRRLRPHDHRGAEAAGRCAPIARTPIATSTGIAGSSLGGLVSLHLGFNHPAVFGRVAALSPSVWWDRKAILKTIREARSKPKSRVWVDMGTAEGRRGLDDARLLKAALVGLGFVEGVDLHYAEYEGATHSEQAWSERVGPMLEWLFPNGSKGSKGPIVPKASFCCGSTRS